MLTIKGILSLLISAFIFDSIFKKLDKINSRIISPFRIIPEKWKGKWIIKWIAIIILLFIPAIMVNEYGVNEILGNILSGFVISLCEFAFKKPLIRGRS